VNLLSGEAYKLGPTYGLGLEVGLDLLETASLLERLEVFERVQIGVRSFEVHEDVFGLHFITVLKLFKTSYVG